MQYVTKSKCFDGVPSKQQTRVIISCRVISHKSCRDVTSVAWLTVEGGQGVQTGVRHLQLPAQLQRPQLPHRLQHCQRRIVQEGAAPQVQLRQVWERCDDVHGCGDDGLALPQIQAGQPRQQPEGLEPRATLRRTEWSLSWLSSTNRPCVIP